MGSPSRLLSETGSPARNAIDAPGREASPNWKPEGLAAARFRAVRRRRRAAKPEDP